MEVIVAPKARRDIADILDWTADHYGPQTVMRYQKLIAPAIEQIAANPDLDSMEVQAHLPEEYRSSQE